MAVDYFSSKRSNSNTSIRNMVVVFFFFNYIGLCKADLISIIDSQVFSLLETLKKTINLPEITDDEFQSNSQEYLAGLKNEDVYLNGTQLIEKYGYNVEEHHVITSDGYDLALYRIPGKGPVVFLMHGLLMSFVDWLTAGSEKGLAYLLASSGYDVWMGNARGNTYSNKNIRWSTLDPEFWEFSWDEIGRFDLPAMIDYVLVTTKKETLTYIGHSQGTTSFFVLCSERPEYNDKINLMIALSPVAWMKHVKAPIMQITAPFSPIGYALLKSLGVNNIAPDNALQKAVFLTLCGNSLLASTICQNVCFLFSGFNYPQIDFKQSPVIFNHFPAGCSLKQLQHYLQLVDSGYFRKFDHGPVKNLLYYKSPTPPSYELNKITAPVAIFYSQNDWLAQPIDVEFLRRKLNNVVDYCQISLPSFNHLDFVWAKDVKSLLYDKVLQLISKYN